MLTPNCSVAGKMLNFELHHFRRKLTYYKSYGNQYIVGFFQYDFAWFFL